MIPEELSGAEFIGPRRRVVVHVVAVKRPWHYRLKSGEDVTYLRLGGGMSVHKSSRAAHLRLNALCTELTGCLLPFREANTENLSTRKVKDFNCQHCRVALDRALESGRVRANKYGTLEIAAAREVAA